MSRADQDGDAHVPGRVDHVAPLVDGDGDVQIFYKHFSFSLSLSQRSKVLLFFLTETIRTNHRLSAY